MLTEQAVLKATWPRDGEELYFMSAGEQTKIWAAKAEDWNARAIADLGGRRGSIGLWALAADEAYVYFAWEDATGDLWVMDVVTDESE